ncbi:hypothetical protein CYMTET_53640 [Cymbomonas tetramitiformis]|uniref:Uncharacterized protein n=1 Tax=Cymbomonas tetramitiformis TaxID=36881 RepID=A0AAE0BHQ4_9CHLO|nr:hypothetical protein CYMTET_53640 [Cymbomonas tetramitiformis]
MPTKKKTPAKKPETESTTRHNYQEVFDGHFEELIKDAKLDECWFGDNPRGDVNDGIDVKNSYALHGNYKYICIDGHGRQAFYTEAWANGCTLRRATVKPKDKMFEVHDANILDGDLTSNEITTLAVAKIHVNDKGAKERTFFQELSMFK